MRKLSKKQKNIIIDYINNDFFESDLLIEKYGNFNILYSQLEKINDYEKLWQDLKRITNDLLFENNKEDKINYVKNL